MHFIDRARPDMAWRPKPRRLAAATLRVLAIAGLFACGGSELPDAELDPPAGTGTELVNLTRTWEYREGRFFDDLTPESPKHRAGFGALVNEEHVFTYNVPSYQPPDRGPDAKGEVRSNRDGTSYGVTIDSPSPIPENKYAVSSGVVYDQKLFYRKIAADAWLDITVSEVRVEAGDGNTRYPPKCNAANAHKCFYNVDGHLVFDVAVHRFLPGGATQPLVKRWGWAELAGLMDSWRPEYRQGESASAPPASIWSASDFEVTIRRDAGLATAAIKLRSPIKVRLDLSGVPLGETFMLASTITAGAYNARQGESGVTVYFQDPISGHALTIEKAGLEPAPVPDPVPTPAPFPQPEPSCTGAVDPAAGRFELEGATLEAGEGLRMRAVVRRLGGSRGVVSVDLSTRAGSATAAADFPLFTRTLVFADGQDDDRHVDFLIPDDALLEGDETFELALSAAKGCAAIGAVPVATVTILDDEAQNQTFTLGGTVTGLVGSGLFLRSNGFDVRVDASGPFTLPGTFASGTVYDLQVEVQPSNPLQACRVTKGQGTITSANVTDLAVACDPPAPPPPGGALDTSFAGGKVANPSYGRIVSMALQPDGALVVLTDFNRLLRYRADGTLDTGFGSNGVVNATLGGSALDLLRAVALQADGGILVAGLARGGTGDDMGVKRYLPNGTADAAFGSAGLARVDFAGRADEATALAVLPDGRIVLGGTAVMSAAGATDFALARLLATGALDTGFGSGGKLTVNIGGNFDSVAALALQADGAIVLAGRAATGAAATPDTGVVRVSAAGVVELALKLPFSTDWDEATSVAVMPDGRIVLALELRVDGPGLYQHAVARLKPDGTPDESFGTLGLALASFSVGGDHARALQLLPDGRILSAGFARGTTQQLSDKDDFLLARLRADGTLDSAFGDGGRLVLDFFGASDGARCLLLLPDGRAVAGGLARSGTDNGLGLLRVLP